MPPASGPDRETAWGNSWCYPGRPPQQERQYGFAYMLPPERPDQTVQIVVFKGDQNVDRAEPPLQADRGHVAPNPVDREADCHQNRNQDDQSGADLAQEDRRALIAVAELPPMQQPNK